MRGLKVICAALAVSFAGASALADEDDILTAASPTFNFDTPSVQLEWHERFTLGDTEETTGFDRITPARSETTSIEFETGTKWGVTLGFDGHDAPLDLEGLRAGAFFNITPRMRIGGQLSFSNPEEDLAPGDYDAEAPEVKLESAFRF